MSELDARLRASIAARMLMPSEEKPDPEALKRLEGHLLALRQRIEDEAESEEAQRGFAEWHQLNEQEERT